MNHRQAEPTYPAAAGSTPYPDLPILGRWYAVSERGGAWTLSTDIQTEYLIQMRGDRATCTCNDFTYRHADNPASKGCKHICALRHAGHLPPV
jgi:SWIM zinc finger